MIDKKTYSSLLVLHETEKYVLEIFYIDILILVRLLRHAAKVGCAGRSRLW